jgi:hypothetical protein
MVIMRSAQGDTRFLHREGWVRSERWSNGSTYIHMAAPDGRHYGVSISPDGRPVSLGLNQLASTPMVGRRTGVRDTVLGERCQVWASEPTVRERVYGGPVLSCVTEDGIVLWSGRGPPRQEGPRIDTRAVALERRTPGWAEFTFPREALDWSYWSSRFAIPETARPAYEVRFGENIIRVRGETRYEGRADGFSLRNRQALLHYTEREGSAARFSISVGPQAPYPHPLTGGSEPLDRPPLRVSGESCNWHRVDLNVRWGIVAVCVTEDGVRLAETTEFDDEAHEDRFYGATYFRRGAPDPALMAPPANAFAPWLAALPH